MSSFCVYFVYYSKIEVIVKWNMKCRITEAVREIVTSGIQVLKRLFDDVFLLEFFPQVFNTMTIHTEI
jgi:hypothetical protein